MREKIKNLIQYFLIGYMISIIVLTITNMFGMKKTIELIDSSENIEMEEVENSIRKIYNRLIFDKKEKFSIIVGTRFFGMKNFRIKLQELENTIKDTFSYFSGIIYTSKTNLKNTDIVEEQFQLKESVMKSIKDKNIVAVKEQLLIYLKRLEDEKTSSAFFAKYLILDIVKAIYQEFGTYNESMIMKTANDIMNSNDLKKVGEVLIKVLEEMDSHFSRYFFILFLVEYYNECNI